MPKELTEVDIAIAKEQLKYVDLVSKFKSKNGLLMPTPMQFLFVKYCFEGYSQLDAAMKAGYKFSDNPKLHYPYLACIREKIGVQVLMGMVLESYLDKRKISAAGLINKAHALYDKCETVKEQLEVLKFISVLAGHTNRGIGGAGPFGMKKGPSSRSKVAKKRAAARSYSI